MAPDFLGSKVFAVDTGMSFSFLISPSSTHIGHIDDGSIGGFRNSLCDVIFAHAHIATFIQIQIAGRQYTTASTMARHTASM